MNKGGEAIYKGGREAIYNLGGVGKCECALHEGSSRLDLGKVLLLFFKLLFSRLNDIEDGFTA